MDLGKLEEMIKNRIAQCSTDSTPEYQCYECHDTGWIDILDENGNRFVRKCACRLAREAEQRMKDSGLGDALKEQTFESFRTDTALQEHMKRVAGEYVVTLFDKWDDQRRPWFYVGGNPGSGKTHICTAICGEILRHNVGVKYMQWLSDSRRLKYANDAQVYEDALDDYINPTVLYIDDLLKQKYAENPVFTEADIKIAFTILNARYLMNKPTIISSEWDLINQLLPADEGVFSRVYERSKDFTIRISRDIKNNFRIEGERHER